MTSNPGETRRPVGAHRQDHDGVGRGTAVQAAAKAVSIVFLLVGVLGFIPGITSDYDSMTFAGHESGAMLLGIFQVSILHNIVHLLFGVVGYALSRTASGARNFLIGGGIVYLLLTLYGLLIDKESAANFVPLNTADDWLHLVLGLGMIGLGFALRPQHRETPVSRGAVR
ncbi:DUF4383 domain-containing protein [Intrasporangium sp.]|uniref:DUF4383 domain-containing protein n=1 Tax=Intrasporangium sp. TaxID=1925024 RepID=UPI00293A8C1F|nr:DUF4383 domain-containing protein [Intrasporangium sp.]MDV3220754.1 DUF4383 domain-containing protein [Intrasporangium sp.]